MSNTAPKPVSPVEVTDRRAHALKPLLARWQFFEKAVEEGTV